MRAWRRDDHSRFLQQQILGGVTHRLINPSRLTGIKEGTKFGTEDWGVVYLAMLDGSSKVLVKRLQIIQLSGALDMVRMATVRAIYSDRTAIITYIYFSGLL